MSEIAIFGGGCFWCTEAVMKDVIGVESVESGYIGGQTENPTYKQVCSGTTGHAEAVRIQFDPDQVNYKRLLNVFFETHDPTTLNRQGADRGTHYRSMVLYADDNQKEQAEAYIKELDASGSLKDPVVTEVVPLDTFYEAEEDHHQFYLNNPDQMYCQIVIKPKVDKVRGAFAEHLR